MSKTSDIFLIVICVLSFISFTWTVIIYAESSNKSKIQSIDENLKTIKIDGEDYLYGVLNKTTVLVPKAKSCNCKCK